MKTGIDGNRSPNGRPSVQRLLATAARPSFRPPAFTKVLLLLVLGLYGVAVAGAWLAKHSNSSDAGDGGTLQDLQALEQRYLQDYQLYWIGQLPESVILREEARMRAIRAKLITRSER